MTSGIQASVPRRPKASQLTIHQTDNVWSHRDKGKKCAITVNFAGHHGYRQVIEEKLFSPKKIKTKPRKYEYLRGLFFVCRPVFTEGKADELLISLL